MNELFFYRMKWALKGLRRSFKDYAAPKTPDVFLGKQVYDLQTGYDVIAQKIESGAPFMVGRYGGNEIEAMLMPEQYFVPEKQKAEVMDRFCKMAGFFPNDRALLKQYRDVMEAAGKEADLLGIWGFIRYEDLVVKRDAPQAAFIHPESIEPWYSEHPWTHALAGKKVLVIHPFADSIRKQYEKRDKLFQNPEILPAFQQLHVLKAVQTIGDAMDSRFQTWFQALDWMTEEALKIDFDVAIIGCGAYGFPLAANLKKAGKQAIQMGGATQILFGIKGKRWETHKASIRDMFNEYWIRPDESEIPEGANKVEDSCYW